MRVLIVEDEIMAQRSLSFNMHDPCTLMFL